MIVKGITFVAPFYIMAFKGLIRLYQILPMDLFEALMGLAICFFGGTYAASITAMEAARVCGWERTKTALLSLYEDVTEIQKINDADNKKDDDGDGVADVDQMTAQQLATRKMGLALIAIKDPEKISAAIGGLYTSWIAVQAVLRIEFAKTIALGISIADNVGPWAKTIFIPILTALIPKEYHHWIPTIIGYVVKTIAVAIAWYLQMVISACQRGIMGGCMFARGIMNFAMKKKWLSLNHEDTYLDEIIGGVMACLGIYFQISNNFTLPFPFNIIMFPFSCVDTYIVWSIYTPESA